MSTHDLSAKLPPPHDEEPAQLRSDILDELQDHLICATDRERRRLQLSGRPADAVTVWQSVIERFGDPAALARRLWFDAMKGRLMTQRVLLGAVSVGVLALVGWMTIMSRTLTSVIDQNQKATAAILEHMAKEKPSQLPSKPSELVPVKFTLTQKTSDGIPVIGQLVHMISRNGEALRFAKLSETTNLYGVADFGVLEYGIYELSIPSIGGTLTEEIILRPERPMDLKIAVPAAPAKGQVKFEFAPPDWAEWDWITEDHKPPAGEPVLLVRYSCSSEVKIDNREWIGADDTQSIVLGADGIYTGLIEVVETQHSLAQFGGGGESRNNDEIENVDRLIDITSRIDTLTLHQGPLRLTAEWLYRVDNAPGLDAKQFLVRPVSRSLNPDYARSLKATQKFDRFKFPLVLDVDPATTQPQVIHVPSNDPSTFDGDELPLLLPTGGGGGFF